MYRDRLQLALDPHVLHDHDRDHACPHRTTYGLIPTTAVGFFGLPQPEISTRLKFVVAQYHQTLKNRASSINHRESFRS